MLIDAAVKKALDTARVQTENLLKEARAENERLAGLEAEVQRLRSRSGTLAGRARVAGRLVASGTMTFALGESAGASA